MLDLMFALLIVSSFIYIISHSPTNVYQTIFFEDQFAYDVANVYSTTGDITLINKMFSDKGYGGSFNGQTINKACDPNKNDVYVKNINNYEIVYCNSVVQ